jgi:PAS domain S-box-containing protein
VIGASKIARDITERTRAEEALHEQAQVMDSAQVFVRDMQSRVVYWPKGAEKLYGFTREEAVGILSHDLFHTQFPEPLQMVERKLFETGMWEGELIHTRRDGRVIVVSSAWALHRDGQGQPVRILETNIDITARKQVEEELNDSQEKLRLAVDGARLGIWNWDLKTGELEGSPLAFALFGLPANVKFDFEIFLAKLHADDRAMVEAAMQRTLATQVEYDVEYRCIWPDGSERWIAAKGRAYLNDGGQTERVGGIVFDVTERRRALEGLRESEDRFRLFVEHAPAALAMFDREMRYLHWSRRWQADYGLDERELRGVSHYELFPEIPERWKEIHRRALAGEVQRGEDDRFDRIDGSVQWIRWEARPWYDRTGAIAGIVIFAEEITARKLAEKALQESETNFRMVVNLVPQFAWICTNEGLNTYFNERWYKYTGLTPEQSLGKGWSTPFHPDDKPKAWAAWNHATATGETYSVESRLQAADGSYRWFLMRGEPLLDDQGGVVKWFGTCIDIDDMKAAQSALRESEERFQAMANGIPQLAWMAEADGNIFWYNQRWYDYTGTTFEQVQGWGWQSVHDPTVLPKVMEGWQAAITAGTPFEMEFPLRRADGRFGSFLTRVRPLRDAEGRVVRWFGTNTDISDLKLAERRLEGQAEELSRQAIELARSRQALEIQTLMLQSVLDSMQEGLVAADETGRFILWNPAATRIVGMGAEDVPPAEWHTHYGVYLPDAVTAFPIEQNPLTRALRGEVSTAEMFVRNPALEHGVWIEISGSPLKSADGSLQGGVAAFRDISQRKNDEREIHELNEQLEERVALRTAELATANQELEAFAYSVSHDLRAPLRHIGGFSKILIEDFGPTLAPEAVRHLERIEEGTRRMGQLVDELLNLAQVGRHALKLQSTPLNALIEEVISLLQPEVQGRVVTWKVAELPAAECDPILMKQVFQNLIANALKFTRPRERAVIEIGIEPEGGQAAVFVRDNGVGFNMKYSDKLFGVFKRLHRIEDFEGTGVGLATVQRIVHKHGGRVWAEAELDKGATFFFTLEPVKGARSKAEEVLRTDAKALNAEEEESRAAAAAGSGNELN